MDSQRRIYYKNYSNMDVENKSTSDRKSTRQRNQKRKGNRSLMQDDTEYVSKLRRANSADYISTGLPPPCRSDTNRTNVYDPLQTKLEQVDVNVYPRDLGDSVLMQLDPLVKENPPPMQLNLPIDISLSSKNFGNPPAMQLDLDPPVNESRHTAEFEDTSNSDLPLDESFRTADFGDTSAFNPDPPVDVSIRTADLEDISALNPDLLLINESFRTADFEDTSAMNPDPPTDESLRTIDIEDTSVLNPDPPVDESLHTIDLEDTSVLNPDPPVDESLHTIDLEDTSVLNPGPPVDESIRTADLEDTSTLNPGLPVLESLRTADLEDTSALNPDPPVDESLCSSDLKDTLLMNPNQPINESLRSEVTSPMPSQFQTVTFTADIHDTPSRRLLKNKNNNEINKQLRDKEIEFCLEEIRKDNNNIKREIPEGCELNEIVIELELEEDENNKNGSTNNKRDKRKTNKELKYQYIDFLSDDECFVWSSSSWDETDDLSGSNKRKKKQLKKTKSNKKTTNKADRSTPPIEQRNMHEKTVPETNEIDLRKKKKRINVSKERSQLRNSGQEYITKTGHTIEAKKMKENPCQVGKCPNECYKIPEEKRRNIFDYYWTLSKERRSDWIVSHSKRDKIKRKRVKDVESRRQWSHSYFINDGEGQTKVCLKFLLNTLDIRQKFVHFTIENSLYGSSKGDHRGKHVPANKTSEALTQSVRSYLENLPAIPSHYCRKNSKKCYLPQEFKNLSNLYKIYKETRQSEGNAFVGEKLFKIIFNTEYHISFHVPRKDKCVKCIKYENDQSEALQIEKDNHIRDKEDTYARFKTHQGANKQDSSVLCVTFDLQKVLNTPYGQSMLLYYSRKLAVYNLTFYESQTREGFCYTWNEAQGKRGANEICTILSNYIAKVDSRGTIKHLLLYCDSCPGQNKNRVVMACIHQCLQKCTSIISIQINYLLPGHTYMPVDSMHAVIEKSVANSIIWAPSQWPTVFGLARKSPKPYEVKILTHKDFEGWDAVNDKYFKGNLVGKISKVRTAIFKKSHLDIMYVKYSMAVDAETEIIEILTNKEIIPKKIYKSQLPISKKKYADLLKLCTNKTIPEIYRSEFIDLPTAANVKDVLPESDIEDEELD